MAKELRGWSAAPGLPEFWFNAFSSIPGEIGEEESEACGTE
jgi:hypothetical protein